MANVETNYWIRVLDCTLIWLHKQYVKISFLFMLVSSCCLELHNTSKCECITVKVAMIVCLFGLFLLLVITVCCLYLPHIKFNLLHVLPLVLGVVFVPGCLFFLLPWLVSKQSKLFFLSKLRFPVACGFSCCGAAVAQPIFQKYLPYMLIRHSRVKWDALRGYPMLEEWGYCNQAAIENLPLISCT